LQHLLQSLAENLKQRAQEAKVISDAQAVADALKLSKLK
jgi:hypothetical protein